MMTSVASAIIVAMAEHQWSPPEHQDVTLHQPVGLDSTSAGPLSAIDPPQPVWVDVKFERIPDVLHLKCFAVASSEAAVLVQTSWQGRLQEVLIAREVVTRRQLDPHVR